MFRFKETVLERTRISESKSIPTLISRNADDINLCSTITVSHMATLKLAKKGNVKTRFDVQYVWHLDKHHSLKYEVELKPTNCMCRKF